MAPICDVSVSRRELREQRGSASDRLLVAPVLALLAAATRFTAAVRSDKVVTKVTAVVDLSAISAAPAPGAYANISRRHLEKNGRSRWQ